MNQYVRRLKTLAKRYSKLSYILVILSYISFTAYYMGPSVWNCNDTLYGFGDNTAGVVWKYGLEPAQPPLGAYENATNYPVGETLYSPVNYSLSGQSYLVWGLSKAAGPICGYNLVNIIGFVASAAVMFGFIYSLTRNKWLAWLAGYAVSFAPYYQMKVGGHPGYGYQALLIAVAWAFFNLIKKQRKKDAFYLGGLLASCFYFDPYFSILAVSVIGPLLVTWFGLTYIRRKNKVTKQTWRLQFRLLVIAMVSALVLLLPLITITALHAKEISASVASLRGNVLFEARACSNLPHEYAVPFVLHPVFGKLLGTSEYQRLITDLHSNFDCGIGEDTVGISMVILTVTSVGLIIFAWEALNKRRLKFTLGYDKKLLTIGLVMVALTAAALALPPLKKGPLMTPAYALLEITSTWRTLTRFYVVVNFAAISLFAIILTFVSQYFASYRRWLKIGFAIIFLIIFVEYQAFRPFVGNKLSTFSYSRDVPAVYTWLKEQDTIRNIAEYPLERSGGESNAQAYYLSMQVVHDKKLFNGTIPTTYEETLRASLKDISDPQSQAVLASLGIDAVVIHGVEEAQIRQVRGLEVIYVAPQSDFNILAYTPLVKKDTTIVAKLVNQPKIPSMLAFTEGFVRNGNVIRSSVDWEYESLNNSLMKLVALPGQVRNPVVSAAQCFSVRMAGDGDTATLTVDVDGQPQQHGALTSEYKRLKITAKESIKLSNDKGFNLRVKDLGCEASEL